MSTLGKRPSSESAEPAAKKAKTDGDEKMLAGTVNSWIGGYGFITQQGGPDVFVHQSVLYVGGIDGYRALKVGQKVEFLAAEENGKFKATKVTAPGGKPLPVRTKRNGRVIEVAADEAKAPSLSGAPLIAAVKKQIEYYLSDKNLKRDVWMRNLLIAHKAVSVSNLLKCNKLKALTTELEVIKTAVTESSVLHMSTIETEPAVARGPDAETMPALPSYTPPSVLTLSDMKDGVTWKDLRAGYLTAYHAPIFVYLSHSPAYVIVGAEHAASTAQAVAGGIVGVDGAKLCSATEVTDEKLKEELLQDHYTSLAKQTHKKKRKEKRGGRSGRKRERQPEPSGPVSVAGHEYVNTEAVYDKVRGIMRSYKNSEPIMGEDKAFMMALFKAHPRSAVKLKGVRNVIVKENTKFDGNSRCFFVVKKNGEDEDISYVKCIRNL
jgi:cold shock CspA family protein